MAETRARATYEEALNAATNMMKIGISPSEMFMAAYLDERLQDVACNLKSDECSEMASEASEDLFSSCRLLHEEHVDIPMFEVVDAVVRCYLDVDMDIDELKKEVGRQTFWINYLL